MPARLLVVFCPAAAVTWPIIDAVAVCAVFPRCCANPGNAHIRRAKSKAPRSECATPSVPVRHNFNDPLPCRMDTREQDQAGPISPAILAALLLGKPNESLAATVHSIWPTG